MTFLISKRKALELSKLILSNVDKNGVTRDDGAQLWQLVEHDTVLLDNSAVVAALDAWVSHNCANEKIQTTIYSAAWRLYVQQPDDGALTRVCETIANVRHASAADRHAVFEIWLEQQRFDLLNECDWLVVRQNDRRVLDASLDFLAQPCADFSDFNRESAWKLVRQNIASLRRDDCVRLRSMAVHEYIALTTLLDALGSNTSAQYKFNYLLDSDGFRTQSKLHRVLALVLLQHFSSGGQFHLLAAMNDQMKLLLWLKEMHSVKVSVLRKVYNEIVKHAPDEASEMREAIDDDEWWQRLASLQRRAEQECETATQRRNALLSSITTLAFASHPAAAARRLFLCNNSSPSLVAVDECQNIDQISLEFVEPQSHHEFICFRQRSCGELPSNMLWITRGDQPVQICVWSKDAHGAFSIDVQGQRMFAAEVSADSVPQQLSSLQISSTSAISIRSPFAPSQFRFVLDRMQCEVVMRLVDLSGMTLNLFGFASVFATLRDNLQRCRVQTIETLVVPLLRKRHSLSLLSLCKMLNDELRDVSIDILDMSHVSISSTDNPEEFEMACDAVRRRAPLKLVLEEHVLNNKQSLYNQLRDAARGDANERNELFPSGDDDDDDDDNDNNNNDDDDDDDESFESTLSSSNDQHSQLEQLSNTLEIETTARQCDFNSDDQSFAIDPTTMRRFLTRSSAQMWNIKRIWSHIGRGLGVRIALLDSGVDISHRWLRCKIIAAKSFVPDEHAWLDSSGHGTACASVIAGDEIGIAPDCSLYVGKVIDVNGVGKVGWLVQGIEWALDNNCQVISLSVGTSSCCPALAKAVSAAYAQGVLIVCAAANDGSTQRQNIAYPARFGNVLCVGSCDDSGNASNFSSQVREVDLVAYGECILSAQPNDTCALVSGTLMAVTSVVGIVAILQAHFKRSLVRTLHCAEIKALLVDMCAHPDTHNARDGHGLLQQHVRYYRPAWLLESLEHILLVPLDAQKLLPTAKESDEKQRDDRILEQFSVDSCTVYLELHRRLKFGQDVVELIPGRGRCEEWRERLQDIDTALDTFESSVLSLDFGFEGMPKVLRSVRNEILQRGVTMAQEHVVQAAQFQTACEVTFRSEHNHLPLPKINFGCALAFVKIRTEMRDELTLVSLFGDANENVDDVVVTADNNTKEGTPDHTEGRILLRLFVVLLYLSQIRRTTLLVVHVHFFTQSPVCHGCIDNIRRFFAALVTLNLLYAEEARFSESLF